MGSRGSPNRVIRVIRTLAGGSGESAVSRDPREEDGGEGVCPAALDN